MARRLDGAMGSEVEGKQPGRVGSPATGVGRHKPTASSAGTAGNLVSGSAYAVGLLSYFWYTMVYGHLVDDPVRAMSEGTIAVIMIQVFYCVVGGLEMTSKLKSQKPKDKRTKETGLSLASKLSSAILATILSLAMSVLVYALLILFGAPAISNVAETFLCAVHIALLSVQPLVFVYNLDSKIWKDIISVKLPLNGVYGASVGTWLGAWLGAIPIPLDWDRAWQRWPITILAGAYIGTAVGTLVGAIYRQVRP
jgi:phosphatidylinositol glycan class F